MPVGSFFGDVDTGRRSLTGSGPASQPRGTNALADPVQTSVPRGSSPTSSTYQPPSTPRGTVPFSPTNVGLFGFMDPANRPSTSNQLSQQAVGGDPLAGARSLLDSYYGPQTELIGNQLARQLTGLGTVPERADYNAGLLQRDTDLSRRGLGLDREAVALDRQSLGIDNNLTQGQLANLDKLRGILAKQFGLSKENLDVQLADLGIDEAKLKDMAGRQKFDLRSALTARGAFNTVANKRGTGRIDRDLVYGLGQIGNARKKADIGYRSDTLGLQEKGIGLDNQGLGLRARLANNGIDSSRLDLALDRIGLSEEQVENQLADGLANIGFEGEAAINGFLDSIQGLLTGVSADQQTAILNDLIGLTGLPADVLAGLLGVAPPTAPVVAPAGGAGGRNQ